MHKKRRDGLLLRTERLLCCRDQMDVLGLCIRLWRYRANFTRTRTKNADRERTLREDVYGRAWQVDVARADIASLEVRLEKQIAERLRSGQALIAKVFGV